MTTTGDVIFYPNAFPKLSQFETEIQEYKDKNIELEKDLEELRAKISGLETEKEKAQANVIKLRFP